MCEECDCTINLVIIFEIVNTVIFYQRVSEFVIEFIVRSVSYTEYIDAISLQTCTEMAVSLREMWGNENKIHKTICASFVTNLSYSTFFQNPGFAKQRAPPVFGYNIASILKGVKPMQIAVFQYNIVNKTLPVQPSVAYILVMRDYID